MFLSILLSGAAFIFTSCTKQLDETGVKKGGDVAMLTTLPSCSTASPLFAQFGNSLLIGLRINNGGFGSKFFYYGTRSGNGIPSNQSWTFMSTKQPFQEASFPDQRIMELTAEVDPDRPQTGNNQVLAPLAPLHFGGRQRIGVQSSTPNTKFVDLGDAIRPGEALVLKLGPAIGSKKMWRVRLTVNGSGVADIEFWDNATKKGEVAVTLTGANAQIAEFSTSPSNSFNIIKLKCQSGNYGIKGLGPDSEFSLVEATNAFVGIQWQNGNGNKFIFRNNIPNPTAAANRQQQIQEPSNFVNFNSNTTNGHKFLLASATGPDPRFNYFGGNFNFGVGAGARLDAGESMIFEVGPDFGSNKMNLAEFKQRSAGQIKADTYDGATFVGSYTSSGIADATFLVGGINNFTKVVLTRVSGTPSLGVQGNSVKFYMSCTP